MGRLGATVPGKRHIAISLRPRGLAPNPTRHPAPFPALPEPPLLVIIMKLWPCNGAAGGVCPAVPSLPHDSFFKDFYAYPEPASERAGWVPVVRLRAPPLSRAGVLFA